MLPLKRVKKSATRSSSFWRACAFTLIVSRLSIPRWKPGSVSAAFESRVPLGARDGLVECAAAAAPVPGSDSGAGEREGGVDRGSEGCKEPPRWGRVLRNGRDREDSDERGLDHDAAIAAPIHPYHERLRET